MIDNSERIPVADLYVRALGRATYNFAYLEWGIVWLTETLQEGFLATVDQLTAGEIARQFTEAVQRLDVGNPDRQSLAILASAFDDLVRDRNRLVHGNPYTAEGGEQRLLYDGKHGRKDWTIELISDFANEVATASVEAGRLLHNGRYETYRARG